MLSRWRNKLKVQREQTTRLHCCQKATKSVVIWDLYNRVHQVCGRNIMTWPKDTSSVDRIHQKLETIALPFWSVF